MLEPVKVSSPRVGDSMDSSSSRSRSYTSQERESKNIVRTPDNTPPRPFTLPPSRVMLPRQLAFGPVGSQLQASGHTKTFNYFQQNSPLAIPQEQATGVPTSASYLQPNSPQAIPNKQTLVGVPMSASYLQPNSSQAIPNKQTLGVPMSASYRTLHAFPSAAPGSLGCSPSTFSVFQFRSNPDP